jgi:hypothetical protein
MSGAIPPFPNTSSWRGAQLKKHRDSFTFSLTVLQFFKHFYCPLHVVYRESNVVVTVVVVVVVVVLMEI